MVVWDGHCDCGAPWLGWIGVRLAGQGEEEPWLGWLEQAESSSGVWASGVRRTASTAHQSMHYGCGCAMLQTDLQRKRGAKRRKNRG